MEFVTPRVDQFDFQRMYLFDDYEVRDNTGAVLEGIKPKHLCLQLRFPILGSGALTNSSVAKLNGVEVNCHCHQTFKINSFGYSDDIRDFCIMEIRPVYRGRVDLSLTNQSPYSAADFIWQFDSEHCGQYSTLTVTQPILRDARRWFVERYSSKSLGVLFPTLSLTDLKAQLTTEMFKCVFLKPAS